MIRICLRLCRRASCFSACYRHVDMYVVALTSDYDAAVEILQQILEKGYRENPEYNPRNVFAKKEFYPGRK